jgi:hypothetical protein
MTSIGELITLPAQVAAAQNGGGRRLALATTGLGIIDHGDVLIERRPSPLAFDLVAAGLVPLLLQHAADRRWPVEAQIGAVREAQLAGDKIEMLVEFGANPRADWIWRDLLAGFVFGCSMQIALGNAREAPSPQPPKKLHVSDSWMLRELTITAALGGADPIATLRRPCNVAELLDEMRVRREIGEALKARALPEWYATPLRRRVGNLIAAAAQPDAAAAITAEIEDYVADPDGGGPHQPS